MDLRYDIKLIENYFPIFEKELVEEIFNVGTLRKIEAESLLISEGQFIKTFPLLLNGTIKITRLDNEGDELLLYYLNKGEVCTMSLTCCISHAKSNIKAIAIEDSELISIPVNFIDEWINKYPSWKRFIMDSYRQRFNELLNTIDSIAFMKMDERLEIYFKNIYKTTGKKTFSGSHQEIANDLHSSREVISRLLKQMEKKKMLILSRNKIDFSSLCN